MRTALYAIPLAFLTGCVIETRGAANVTAGVAPPPPAAPVVAAAPPPAAPPPAAPPPVAPPPVAPPPVFAPPPPAGGVAAPVLIGGAAWITFDPLPAAQPPVIEPPPPATPAPVPAPIGVVNGQPPHLHPGAPAGYWVWRDANAIWHVRTTTKNALHRFHGKLTATSGDFFDVRPVRLEFNDRMKFGPKTILFAFDTQGHMDGFDFRVSGNQCTSFNLAVGGGKRVVVGGSEVQPASHHFTLCP